MILDYVFMQRALGAGLLIAIACSILGIFLLLRKNSFIGEGLAHISFAGIAVGLVAGVAPLPVSVVLTVFGAVAMIKIKESTRIYSDTSVAILSYTGLALGIFIVSASRGYSAELFSYLFGNILTISNFDLIFSSVLAAAVIVFIFLYFNDLSFMTFDEETAKTAGINVGLLNYMLAVLVAVTVVVSMRVVGIMLVASFMIIPAASSLQFSKGFRETIFISILFGVASVIAGLLISYAYDFAAGATIVLISFLLFMISAGIRRLMH